MSNPAKKILSYTLMPEVLPRVQEIITDGFGSIAFWIACLFANAKLLPPTHPYLNPANIRRYGVGNVLGQAALNLKFSYNSFDQVIIFGMVLLGCALFLTQIILMGVAVFSSVAHAAPATITTFADYFLSPLPEQDISFMALDRIFGIPGIFDSCVALNLPCLDTAVSDGAFPFPYHTGLQNLLEFYSQGLLLVATIILCYLVFTMVAETAETGHFFGKRFNKVWAPLRLIAAIGLLIPMGYGYNAAQWIVLYVAKYGSGFGTNTWNYYVDNVTAPSTLLGDPALLLAKPNYPPMNQLIQFMTMAQTCWYSYDTLYHYIKGTTTENIVVRAYVVREVGAGGGADFMRLDTFLDTYPTLAQAQQWSNYGDITIVFGDQDDKWADYKGNVRPYCGELTLPTNGINSTLDLPSDQMIYNYLQLVRVAWYTPAGAGGYSTEPLAQRIFDVIVNNNLTQPLPDMNDRRNLITLYRDWAKAMVDTAYTSMTTGPIVQALWASQAKDYGWAGAGIWYNKIAQVNGWFSEAVFSLPVVTKYPEISEQILQARQNSMEFVPGPTRFDPNIPPGTDDKNNNINFSKNDRLIALALNQSYILFNDMDEDELKPATGNALYDGIDALFKKTGLWSMRANTNIHPLAQMAGLGKTLLTNTVYAFGAGTAAGIINIMGQQNTVSAVAGGISKILLSVAYIGLAAGILLYYVVPFLPFIYFFFAVVGWAKTIFEAIIGIPMWALAHLRYDGPGFPTQQAMYGYGLLLDIFIRPTLIVFGLVASSTCFYAIAKTFNDIFDIAVSNLSGFNAPDAINATVGETGSLVYARGPLDQLAFTIMYAVIIYMMGMGCFKMIDMFPNKILRWMRSNATGFASQHQHDHGEQLAGGIKGQASQIGGAVTSQLRGDRD